MSIRITYFVHGTTTDNEQDLATGWLDGELSELGRDQAKKLGEMVARENYDVMFCSDLKRAVDSAYLGFGDMNGKPVKIFKERMEYYVDTPFPNGESYRYVEKRLGKFLQFLKENYNGKHIAVVAHQAPQLALEVLLNNKTWQQAIATDWRNAKAWQPGWKYEIKD